MRVELATWQKSSRDRESAGARDESTHRRAFLLSSKRARVDADVLARRLVDEQSRPILGLDEGTERRWDLESTVVIHSACSWTLNTADA